MFLMFPHNVIWGYMDQNTGRENQVISDIGKTAAVLGISVLAGHLFDSVGVSEANIITIYLLGVLIIAVITSKRLYSIAASLFSIIIFNFLYVNPKYTFFVYDIEYAITFMVMFASSILAGSLTLKIKFQVQQSEQIALRTQLLLDTNRLLQKEREIRSIMLVAVEQLVKLLKCNIVLYRIKDGVLEEPEFFEAFEVSEEKEERISKPEDRAVWAKKEKRVAEWSLKHREMAGASTKKFPDARRLYVPIQSNETAYGVIGIALESSRGLEPVEMGLMLSILSECALIAENEAYRQKEQETKMQAEQEKFRVNLLRSISHDLRTPLTSISGSAGILMSNVVREENKMRLYTDIYDDSMWLINLVENLLSVTRIENGIMNVHMQAELLEEIITEALKHINRNISEHGLSVEIEDDLLLVHVDSGLIMQVIINIVNNAVEYTQRGSQILIRSRRENGFVWVEVADDGPGIADNQKSLIFDMFYKAGNMAGDSHRGMGLGLALCKSIIIAHGGEIKVKNRRPAGTVFAFSLPVEEVAIHGE